MDLRPVQCVPRLTPDDGWKQTPINMIFIGSHNINLLHSHITFESCKQYFQV